MLALKISLYLFAIIISNFVVHWMGSQGLIFTALFLIPFDYVMRCYFHEKWSGKELILKLGSITILGSLLTFAFNQDTLNIAIGSSVSFFSAQIMAGLFYRINLKRSYFVKVNGSDLIAIIVDSLIFQMIAFQNIDLDIFYSQVFLKFIGGLFWYSILFRKGRESFVMRDIERGE
jgi:hypothetical protein